jgi:hypothetical protein
MKPRAPKSKRVRWSDLEPFPDNPPVSMPRIGRLMKERGGYDPTALGTPEIADNSALAFPDYPEDTLFILDGNNRYVMAELGGALDDEVIVKLWSGLSEAEMHERCDGINDRRSIKPVERFLRRCKRPVAGATQRAIKAAVEEQGWEIGFERGPGKLTCTKELEWIWAGGRRPSATSGAHAGAVARALECYSEAFGTQNSVKDGRMASLVKGLGAFWLLYPDADLSGVVGAISDLATLDLYNKGRQRKEDLRLTNLYGGIVDVVRNRYNKGRRSGRLPERRIGKSGAGSWIE